MKRTRSARPRLTEAEWAAWDAARQAAGGREMSAWVRRVVHEAIGYEPTPEEAAAAEEEAKRAPRPPRPRTPGGGERDQVVDVKTYQALVRTANNLNQLARWANVEGRYPDEAVAMRVYEAVRVAVVELRAAIRAAERRQR